MLLSKPYLKQMSRQRGHFTPINTLFDLKDVSNCPANTLMSLELTTKSFIFSSLACVQKPIVVNVMALRSVHVSLTTH